MMVWKRRWTVAGWSVVWCSGCFSYVPTEPGTIPPGDEVRVHLTREQAEILVGVTDQPDVQVHGRLVARDSDQLILRVPVAVQPAAITTRTLGQDVAIPARRIARVERRELNRARTGLAAAGGVAAVAGVLFAYGLGVPNPELPPRREPEEFRRVGWELPLFSLRVR